MKKFTQSLSALLLTFTIAVLCSSPALAAAPGYRNDVRPMLEELNRFRTGEDAWYWSPMNLGKEYPECGALKWDRNLESIAKIRAREIQQLFSHTRPNGQSCFTVRSNGAQSWGENIAAGQTSAEQVFEDWREDNRLYSGQGHRRNMLNPDFKAVGMAHFVSSSGMDYWVQEFGYQVS